MNTQDKIYVMTDFVPERNKTILTECKVYQATKVANASTETDYTILAADNIARTIDLECCAYLDGKPWCPMYGESYTHINKEDTASNMNKEQAWKILALSEKPIPYIFNGEDKRFLLGGSYSKEEIQAILLVWDELK
jgi:hypothetical protein